MSDPFGDRPIPRPLLVGAAVLIGCALLTVAAARISGVGVAGLPQSHEHVSRDLVFEDRADGAILVYHADDRQVVDVLEVGTGGFVRGVMRSVARARKLQNIGSEAPVRLTLWEDQRLSLEDPTTGYRVELNSFGPDNAISFARLLDIEGAEK